MKLEITNNSKANPEEGNPGKNSSEASTPISHNLLPRTRRNEARHKKKAKGVNTSANKKMGQKAQCATLSVRKGLAASMVKDGILANSEK